MQLNAGRNILFWKYKVYLRADKSQELFHILPWMIKEKILPRGKKSPKAHRHKIIQNSNENEWVLVQEINEFGLGIPNEIILPETTSLGVSGKIHKKCRVVSKGLLI